MKDLRLTVPLFLLTVIQFLLAHLELLWVWMSIAVWEACTGLRLLPKRNGPSTVAFRRDLILELA